MAGISARTIRQDARRAAMQARALAATGRASLDMLARYQAQTLLLVPWAMSQERAEAEISALRTELTIIATVAGVRAAIRDLGRAEGLAFLGVVLADPVLAFTAEEASQIAAAFDGGTA